MMRALLIAAFGIIAAVAQVPAVHLTNTTRPAASDFQVGDGFQVVVTGAANQPVSIRTTMQGRTDWGPVAGWTDTSGRWSATGQFEKRDFGGWSEVWTVGGKLATPAIRFSVHAPCLKVQPGTATMAQSGPNMVVTCETAEGRQSFATPSLTDSFRTPDGRIVPGRNLSSQTAEEYHAEIMDYLITSRAQEVGSGLLGDEAGALIVKLIGPNALSDAEIGNVMAVVRAAFAKPDRIPQAAKAPSATLGLLQALSDASSQESLKQQIADTMAYIQRQ